MTNVDFMLVAGARPNFVKLAPLHQALATQKGAQLMIVHTGQHYDHSMSGSFFEDLGIPQPEVNLEVGPGSHGQQTAAIMVRFEPLLDRYAPRWVIVFGDVNSTIACALVAAKAGVAVAHVEAGLRSRDWTMPEEINRALTDRLSELLFTPSRDGDENLAREGIEQEKIHFVGNAMIDSLHAALPRARESRIPERLGLERGGYALATLHRPANVDEPRQLARLFGALSEIAAALPVVFPIH